MLTEEKIVFPAGPLMLEGCYVPAASGRGAVVTHPHPLMGGSMENNVVETLVSAFSRQGCATLRFNFRGVGRSAGSYDEGIGEQQDVLAAVDFLRHKGIGEILLAGYSFGAWVNVKVLRHAHALSGGVLVSPPIDMMDFDFSGLSGRIRLILTGDQDPYCNTAHLMAMANRSGAPVKILPGVDHFYFGREKELSAGLADLWPGPSGQD